MHVGLSSLVSVALQGVQSAQREALAAMRGVVEGGLDDLAENWSRLSLARVKQQASLQVLKTAMDADRDVLDILA